MKQMIGFLVAMVLWIVSIILWATGTLAWLFIALFALHFVELVAIGYRTGRSYGYTPLYSIVMGMLFGYLWWLPLRKNMQADELSNDDFTEDGQEPWREAFER